MTLQISPYLQPLHSMLVNASTETTDSVVAFQHSFHLDGQRRIENKFNGSNTSTEVCYSAVSKYFVIRIRFPFTISSS